MKLKSIIHIYLSIYLISKLAAELFLFILLNLSKQLLNMKKKLKTDIYLDIDFVSWR